MKRFAIAVLLVSFGGSAFAADMAVKAAPKAPPPPPAPMWTGFYLGGEVGWADSRVRVTDVNGFAAGATPGTVTSYDHAGFMGGGQLGYNWQFGSGLFGIEGDLGWMGLHHTQLLTGTASNTMIGLNSGAFGDITGRLGLVAGNALFYVKGGGAFYDGHNTFSTRAAFTANSTGTYTGWTAGAGIEYLFLPNWSAKVEYLHYGFSTQSYSLTPPTFVFNEALKVDSVKVGLNYHFH